MPKCEHHDALEKKLEKLENKGEKMEGRIGKLERRSDVSDEQYENIKELIGDLKISLNEIAENLKESQKRPIDLFYKILAAIIVAVILFGWGIK